MPSLLETIKREQTCMRCGHSFADHHASNGIPYNMGCYHRWSEDSLDLICLCRSWDGVGSPVRNNPLYYPSDTVTVSALQGTNGSYVVMPDNVEAIIQARVEAELEKARIEYARTCGRWP